MEEKPIAVVFMLSSFKEILRREGSVTLSVRARPGASKTQIKDVLRDGSVKIDIAAVPEDNAANEELVKFLAKQFAVSRSNVSILSGAIARVKLIRIYQNL
jgi:uncharacterized protein (TIGR00251 family)